MIDLVFHSAEIYIRSNDKYLNFRFGYQEIDIILSSYIINFVKFFFY